MHATIYLNKILKNGGWECCPKDEEKIIEPLHSSSIKELESTVGPTTEAKNKQLEAGKALCLQDATTRQREYCMDLPEGNNGRRLFSKTDMQFIGPEKDDQLGIYVNATHETDLKCHRSIGGQVATFTGTAIAYSATWQITVTTSSPEA
eukprot:9280010-Ditylum_brightwellii.AAC.1